MIVVFDTTVLHRDVHASRPLMRQVLEGAANGDWRVVVPAVVVEEAARQFPDRLRHAIAEARRVVGALRVELEALGLPAPQAPDADVEALTAEYETNLRAMLTDEGCSIADPPSRTELVGTWAAMRRRPFKQAGTGACDAFVWLTVLDLADEDEVVLVSANSTDFGDPEDRAQLAPELRADLGERGHDPARVRRVDSLHQLLPLVLTPTQQALQGAQALLADPEHRARLISRISLDAAWTPSEWEPVTDWNLGVYVEDFRLVALDLDDLELESAELAADGTLTMLLHGTGTGSFNFFVQKSEMLHAPEDSPVEVYDPDWNDWYMWAQASLPAEAEVAVQVDEAGGMEISVEGLEPA